MSKIIKEVEIRVCDLCERHIDIFNVCPLCNREICVSICSSLFFDVFKTNICKKCNEQEDIHQLLLAWHKHWTNDRNVFVAELKRRGKGSWEQ